MAEVKLFDRYMRPTGKTYKGRPIRGLDGTVAHMGIVRAGVKKHAHEIADKARVRLASHRFEGHTRIEVHKGRLDYYVTMVDGDGEYGMAMSIEYGRKGYPENPSRWHRVKSADGRTFIVGKTNTKPTYILHRASGLPIAGRIQ